jgi:hypothetical protein
VRTTKLLTIILLSYSLAAYSDPTAPPRTGNFSLPTSQQPVPLISFGQTIVNKGQSQLFLFADYIKGNNQIASDVVPYFIYGITDNLTFFMSQGVATKYQQETRHSAGVEDTSLQLEYAVYGHKTKRYEDQATVLVDINLPTGSHTKQPPTGAGTPSYFIGGTYSRTYNDWYAFAAPGVIMAESINGSRLGNQYLYQAGLARNVYTIEKKLIILGMVELDGQYSAKSTMRNHTNPNSGGNIIYLTPSIFVGLKQLVIQFGFGLPVVQHLNGEQIKNNYLLATNMGWTFS